MGNLLVLLVTVVHTVMVVSNSPTRKPVINQKNNIHVEKFCENKVRFMSGFHELWMNSIHYMCGLDMADQNIS